MLAALFGWAEVSKPFERAMSLVFNRNSKRTFLSSSGRDLVSAGSDLELNFAGRRVAPGAAC